MIDTKNLDYLNLKAAIHDALFRATGRVQHHGQREFRHENSQACPSPVFQHVGFSVRKPHATHASPIKITSLSTSTYLSVWKYRDTEPRRLDNTTSMY